MWKLRFIQIAVGVLISAGAAFGQAATPASNALSFEVASIKRAAPLDPAAIMSGKAHLGMSVDNARLDIGGATLMGLICQAYKIRPNQISGSPAWLNATGDRFDILAKLPEGATKDQVSEMLRSLLADRFKLTVHRETRETPVYALIVAKGGPKLTEASPDPPAPASETKGSSASSGGPSGSDDSASSGPASKNGEMAFGSGDNRVTVQPSNRGAVINTKETGPMRMERGENGGLRMEADSMTMESFATMLSRFADYPVVDMTQLKGKYKVSFEIPRDALMSSMRQMGLSFGMNPDPTSNSVAPAQAASDPSSSSGSLLTSVQELGLKLEKRKLPYDFVVIDHVEKTPTEN